MIWNASIFVQMQGKRVGRRHKGLLVTLGLVYVLGSFTDLFFHYLLVFLVGKPVWKNVEQNE